MKTSLLRKLSRASHYQRSTRTFEIAGAYYQLECWRPGNGRSIFTLSWLPSKLARMWSEWDTTLSTLRAKIRGDRDAMYYLPSEARKAFGI